MYIDKNSLIVNNVNLGQYILEAKYSYNKLWSNDSGRNLAGTQSGTLIGIFPKIVVQFRKLTKIELETIINTFHITSWLSLGMVTISEWPLKTPDVSVISVPIAHCNL